jgi:hypothetical protein
MTSAFLWGMFAASSPSPFIHIQFLAANTMGFSTTMQWVVSALTNQRTDRLIIEARDGGNEAAG